LSRTFFHFGRMAPATGVLQHHVNAVLRRGPARQIQACCAGPRYQAVTGTTNSKLNFTIVCLPLSTTPNNCRQPPQCPFPISSNPAIARCHAARQHYSFFTQCCPAASCALTNCCVPVGRDTPSATSASLAISLLIQLLLHLRMNVTLVDGVGSAPLL
jgi:hypothetical protein